jgi:ABC-type transporter Mla subunit MlaD
VITIRIEHIHVHGTSPELEQSLRRIENDLQALRIAAAASAAREEYMAGQGDQIKALLQRMDAATTEAAKDVSELIAKIRAGAPDLLTADEMAAAEATVARLEALGRDTDAATVGAETGETEPAPVDEV